MAKRCWALLLVSGLSAAGCALEGAGGGSMGEVTDEGDPVSEDGEAEPQVAGLAQALIGPSDVGVLTPAATNCPNEHIVIPLENERDDNANWHTGWIGATEQDHDYTKLHVCRVDGRSFHQAKGTSTSLNYAVLKLGSTCPAGAVDMERYFDNEDATRRCTPGLACPAQVTYAYGNIAPSYFTGNNLHLSLCLFRASATGSDAPLPRVGIPYGVLGTPSLPNAIASGWLYTDDEDGNNANYVAGDYIGSDVFLSAGPNTTLRLVEVDPPLPRVQGPILSTVQTGLVR